MSRGGRGGSFVVDGNEEWAIDPEEGTPVPKRVLYEDKLKPKIIKGAPCMPGQKICVANEYYEAGQGAYEEENIIYASVLGWLCLTEYPDQELTVVSVEQGNGKQPFASPHVGAIVTCTIVSRTRQLVRGLITYVGNVKLDDPIRGIIRRENINDKHRDATETETSFGIGDTVLARVVDIGDGDFIMSTAEDALGVATAISKAGYYMVPIGWTMMECPKTKETEPRKVAKIIQNKNVEYWHARNSGRMTSTSSKSKSLQNGSLTGV